MSKGDVLFGSRNPLQQACNLGAASTKLIQNSSSYTPLQKSHGISTSTSILLRLGLHPKHIEQELDRNLKTANNDDDDYRVLFRSVCQRMLNNLKRKNLFKKLPPLGVYGELIEDPVRKARFQVMMYNRFEDRDVFNKVEEDPLDSASLEVLEALHETVLKEIEANYIVNRKFLELSPPEPFASTNAENPFVYGMCQKSWEGPGNRLGQYSLSKDPYVAPHKKLAPDPSSDHAVEVTESDDKPTSFTSHDSTTEDSESNNDGSESSFKSAQTSMTIPSIHPRTPKNMLEKPEFRYEHVGHAFCSRPISLGSPTKVKRPRSRYRPGPRDVEVKRPECVEVENCGISLDIYFDCTEHTEEKSVGLPSLAKLSLDDSEKSSSSEQASGTLEECMNWAEDLVKKNPLPETSNNILGDKHGWSNAMDWD
ncbi:hypothetical protein DL98DRAFT_656640 [Cadophora sp. DSE1049]|nr:hypothetical protein DL98DRAFT_656640 [Cadophora sp. DSE1049]